MKKVDSAHRLLVTALLAGVVSGCGSARPSEMDLATIIALDIASSPIQDAVVWTIDKDQQIWSHWLKGSGNSMEMMATRPGLSLPWGDSMWLWQPVEHEQLLCDCDAWQILTDERECPEGVEPALRQSAQLVDLVSRQVKDVVPLKELPDEAWIQLGELNGQLVPIASVGQYLFVAQREEGQGCDARFWSFTNQVVVIDLEQQQAVPMVTAEELERIRTREQRVAFEELQHDSIRSADELQLSGIIPFYDQQEGLRVSYQFTSRLAPEATTTHAESVQRAVTIPAAELPMKLAPFADVPPIVQAFALAVWQDGRTYFGGWVPVVGSVDRIQSLFTAFSTSASISTADE